MNIFKNKLAAIFIVFAISTVVLSSCSTPKNITYFSNLADSGAINGIQLAEYKTPLIKVDDIIGVSIETIDPAVTAIVNQPLAQSAETTSSQGQQSGSGYLVNKEGVIELPLIGKIKVIGLTTYQAADTIQKVASQYLKSPTVQVRFLNFKITVIGEVNRPATYTMPNEKVSIIDALGLAGDLTIYGKRENILVIHDIDGRKEFSRINLTSAKVFESPSYFLKQNDVVYVEPNNAKKDINNAPNTRTITILVSIVSVLALILVRFK